MNVPQKILIGSCTVLFMCSCLIAQAASHTVQTRLIAPLSDQKSLEQWFVRPSTELELVKWPDGTPGFCAKLTLHKYEGKGEQWPAIIRKENFILVKDWTNIRTLKFPIYVEEDGFLRIHFTTKGPGNAKGFAHNLKVRAGRNHMEIPAEILRAMPLKHITSIHFLLIRPKNTKVFYIGDVTADFEDPTTLVKALKLRTMAFSPADFNNVTKEKKDLALVTLEKFRELTGQLPDHGTLPLARELPMPTS